MSSPDEDRKRSQFLCQSCSQPWARSMVSDTSQLCTHECVSLPCLNCGTQFRYHQDSHEANRVFNVFCNGECEDRYAAKQ